jgi:hypothetical protein
MTETAQAERESVGHRIPACAIGAASARRTGSKKSHPRSRGVGRAGWKRWNSVSDRILTEIVGLSYFTEWSSTETECNQFQNPSGVAHLRTDRSERKCLS